MTSSRSKLSAQSWIQTQPCAKQAAFAARVKWLRGQPLGRGDQALARINSFIRYWGDDGVIVRQDGPLNDRTFPSSIWVETEGNPILDSQS